MKKLWIFLGSFFLIAVMVSFTLVQTDFVPGKLRTNLSHVFAGSNAPEEYRGDWESMKDRGRLRVITSPSEDIFLTRDGMSRGYEEDIACEFARRSNLECVVIEAPSYDSILPWVQRGVADIAVASLTVTPDRSENYLSTRPLKNVYEYLIGPSGESISDISELASKTLALRPGSSYMGTVHHLRDSLNISIRVDTVPGDMHTEEILYEISRGTYDYTLADSDIARAALSYMDTIDTLMRVSDLRNVAWFLRKDSKNTKARLDSYLREYQVLGDLNKLQTGDLPIIREANALRVITRNNSASYWIHRGKEVGFDFELAKAFARKLGVNLKILVADSRDELLSAVQNGRADIAAATITRTQKREEDAAFSVPYLRTREKIVTRANEAGESSVQTVEDLAGAEIVIRRGSAYEETLKNLRKTSGMDFTITTLDETVETEEILWKVAEGEYDMTLADEYLVLIELNRGRNLALGPALSQEREIAWALRTNAPLLKDAVDEFFTTGDYRPRSLQYNMLYNTYFSRGTTGQSRAERADIQNRLSEFDELIQKYAQKHDFDWRLIAAQIYQESMFDPRAESWAGARGLMQLMPATARQFISGNLFNPEKNIYAGTQYMTRLINRFDRELSWNERFNFALASYNAGYGHVRDAQRLAVRKGLEPDVWFGNVEEAILLLSQPKYYQNARYGYCRGYEPVQYVDNITTLFDRYRQIVD
ncbi:MAG: membrane-bound lytic murein transglycosylase MltF [Fibrobacterota bacterium]